MFIMIWVYFGLNPRTFLTAEIVSFDITKSQKHCRSVALVKCFRVSKVIDIGEKKSILKKQ